jgi:hypothetical protein
MTEPLSLSVVSEAVSNQPNGTVKSTSESDVNVTPPPASTVKDEVMGLTLGSDEESSLLQKQLKNQKSTQKQRNVSIYVALET